MEALQRENYLRMEANFFQKIFFQSFLDGRVFAHFSHPLFTMVTANDLKVTANGMYQTLCFSLLEKSTISKRI